MAEVRRVLIVGAGSVGKSYAYHLAQGGAHVTLFTRPQYRSSLLDGYVVQHLSLWGRPRRSSFKSYDVITTLEEVHQGTWCQVWLCVSSVALRGQWLSSLLEAAEAPCVVTLQPGIADSEVVRQASPRMSALVEGVITLIAYEGALGATPNATQPQTLTLWLPPGLPAPFMGPRTLVDQVVECLRSGGMAAAYRPQSRDQAAMASALMMPILMGLEVADWTIDDLLKGPQRAPTWRAAAEATYIASAMLSKTYARVSMGVIRGVLPIALTLARLFAPFPLEAFLKHHFLKVGDQTTAMIEVYVEYAEVHALKADNLKALLQAVNLLRATSRDR